MSKKPVRVECSICAGRGDMGEVVNIVCSPCEGRGWVPGFFKAEKTCRRCAGEGTHPFKIEDPCQMCDGNGYLVEMRDIIPASTGQAPAAALSAEVQRP